MFSNLKNLILKTSFDYIDLNQSIVKFSQTDKLSRSESTKLFTSKGRNAFP